MGVQGLWKLVAPAGRRIKIETLENRILAIDVSIWLLKMIHGYLALGNSEHRDIHLTGIFRRIVKLLYYGIKPVFVFDGKFPELKRETVRRRQEFRERRKINLKKVAEKFLTKVLEDRLKETVGRALSQKRSSPTKPKAIQSEFEGGFLERQAEEEEKVFNEDTNVFDYEFDYIVDENRELLLADGVDLEEFYLQDTETQYSTIKKVKNKMRDKKIKKYLDIDSLDDHSKAHVKDYVKHVQRKNKLEKSREEASSKRITQEQELVMTSSKFKDIMSSNYMKSFFLDPKKEIVHGSLASDRSKGFMYLTQKNDKYDTQVLKVEKKRGSRNEKLKRLSAHLREVAQHAENAPQFFSFDELLCDNPLEAFRHSNVQARDAASNAKNSIAKNQDIEKKLDEESQTKANVNVDDVFGFDDWEEKAETTDVKEEEQNEEKKEVVEQDDVNSNLEDLFEYHMEDQEVKEEDKSEDVTKNSQDIQENAEDSFQIFSQNSGIEDIKIKIAKLKEEMRAEMQEKEKFSQKFDNIIDAHKIFENLVEDHRKSKEIETLESPIREKKKVLKRDNTSRNLSQEEIEKRDHLQTMEETYYEPEEIFTEEMHSSPKDIVFRKQKEEESEVIILPKKQEKGPKENTLSDDRSNNDIEVKEEKSTQLEDFKSPSPRKQSDDIHVDIEKAQEESEVKSVEQNTQVSWYQRLMKETADELKEIEELEEDKEMEIVMTKEPEETKSNRSYAQEQNKPEQKAPQTVEYQAPELADDFDFMNMDMDEEELVAQMKDLDDPDNLDKWALMQEFQKFQNLSEFEAGSIQEKFNEIKELLLLFGIPWVDSPTEAEAQCSYLEQHGLVDGIVTDDSDAFLFGGKHIYRNIFEKGDFAHSYKMNYIENDMALDRDKLILLALFLGSDYTLGIKGVGIVNAIEIITAFDNVEALKRFKEWAEVSDVLLENASEHYRNVPQKELDYKLFHRNFKKHWELPDNFPDERVIEAYKQPVVDESLEKFQWGQPDFTELTKYCENRLRWDEGRINNLLEPLKRAISERGNQSKITDYFKEEKIALVNSKRISDAIKNLRTKEADDFHKPATITKSIDNIIESQNPRNIKKRKTGDYANEMIKHYAFDKKRVKKNS